jgi:protein-ribulosamine 3-kinase
LIDDLGMWRAARYRTNKAHIRAYHKLIEISAPVEDHDDRNALYALRVDLEVSCGWPANKRMRQLAMEEMRKLIEKHPKGLEGFSQSESAA